MIEKQFDILEKNRKLVLKAVDNLTIEQINKIPKGFNNNIAWNIAHLVVTQQLLCYKLSGLDCYVDEKSIQVYRKGTAPDISVHMTEEEFSNYKKQFTENVNKLKEDYKKGKFTSYNTYTTSVDVTLNCVEDAIAFNNLHEGLHLGSILALKKLI